MKSLSTLCILSEVVKGELWSPSQVIWTFCFALILVVSILGNGIVLWIILGNLKEHQTLSSSKDL